MFTDHKVASGSSARASADTEKHRLQSMFANIEDVAVADVTPSMAQKAYDDLVASGTKVDTHRNCLKAARSMFRWAKSKEYADGDPMADIAGVGRRKKGKEQLRIDEARKVLARAIMLGESGDNSAIAVATVLLLGLRASECVRIEARDLDDNGTMLVVPKSKTEAGVRRLLIPEVLQPLLKSLAKTGPLFPEKTRYWVYHHVGRICKESGVTEVCPHGLRGTHATIATMGGASSDIVAASLGHSSARVTEEHYIKPGVAEAARNRQAWKVLQGGLQ